MFGDSDDDDDDDVDDGNVAEDPTKDKTSLTPLYLLQSLKYK